MSLFQEEVDLADAVIRQSYTGRDGEAARKLAYAVVRIASELEEVSAKARMLTSLVDSLYAKIPEQPSPKP